MEPLKRLVILWHTKRIEVEVEPDFTVGDLKYVICKKTGLKPFLQTFVNLNLKERNIDDTCMLTQLQLTNESLLLMDGELDEERPSTSASPCSLTPVRSVTEIKMPLQEIQQQINVMHVQPRPGKNLLVLDVDLTIFDCSEEAQYHGGKVVRPYLQHFLTSVYEYYDIIIWSATHMNVIMNKMNVLGIRNNPNYTILAYYDRSQMITATLPGLHVTQVKQLDTIWLRYKEYNQKNTIILDDQKKNFYLNPANGLKVSHYSYKNYETDKELLYLATYLKYLFNFCDVTFIDHTCWKECIKV